MDLDVFKPTFLISIEGEELSLDITQEISLSLRTMRKSWTWPDEYIRMS